MDIPGALAARSGDHLGTTHLQIVADAEQQNVMCRTHLLRDFTAKSEGTC
jgi:hypothetical protein